MKRLIQLILVLAAGLISSCRQSAPTQAKPVDLPPSPYALPAATEPRSASYSRDAARALELHAASTNAAVIKLLGEIRDMKQSLSVLESNAWQQDPLLLVFDRYIDRTHDWAMDKHHDEIQAEMSFFYSTNKAEAASLQKTRNDLGGMMRLILLKKLGDNTNFAPLVKSTYDVYAEFIKPAADTNAMLRSGLYSYLQYDRVIGYRGAHGPPFDWSYADVQSQIGKRSDLLTARIAQMQREQKIPAAVMAGVKYNELYHLLDGAAEFYLDVRTPPEVQKLRQDLQRKLIDLSWLLK